MDDDPTTADFPWLTRPLVWLVYLVAWSMIVLTVRPYDWFMRWDHQGWTRRNTNYRPPDA